MKLIKFFSIAALTVMAAISCSKEQVVGTTPTESCKLTVTAGCETKAYLDASGETAVMKWRTTDVLVVFDNELNGVELTNGSTNGSTTATFTTDKWTGKTPEFAAAYCPNYGEARILTSPSKGVMSVKFRATLPIDFVGCSGFMSSAMVGKVSENAGAYAISEMKNVMGYLGFTLSTSSVKKITVESIGGESVAGWVDVDYAKLEANNPAFWTATAGKAQETKITLTPTSNAKTGNCFKPGTYYTSLIPQTYAQGLKFTLYNESDAVIAEKTVGATDGITIARSNKVNISKAIDIVQLNLPETVILDLNFGSGTNPLGFTSPGLSNESESGDTYSFQYYYEDSVTHKPMSATFPVVICRGTPEDGALGYRYLATTQTSYGNATKVLQFQKCLNGWVKAPAIEGYYLQSILLAHGNMTATQHMRIKDDPANSSIAQMTLTKGGETAPATMTVHFYEDGNDCNNASMTGNTTKVNTAYYMIFAEKNQVIDRLTFTYTKSLPTR